MSWHLDENFQLDQENSAVTTTTNMWEVEESYSHKPFTGIEDVFTNTWEIDVVHATPIDLTKLLPAKFLDSDRFNILHTYLRQMGLQFGIFLTAVEDIVKLLGPNTVASVANMRYLGALIGVEFPPEDEATPAEIRKTLVQAIDWYKLKGTYKSVEIIAMISGYTANIYDMYTNDYSTFLMTNWFVGGEDENPPGLDSSYYKSPHFGVEVVLDKVYTEGSLPYLWYEGYFDNMIKLVHETRPVHTVPHFLILLNPKTDEFFHVVEVNGEIFTRITENWEYSIKYFDAVGSASWTFDSGDMQFDASSLTFIQSIVNWELGTGNPGINDSNPTIQNAVLSGTVDVDDIIETDEYYQWEFIVPKTEEQLNITELGLYDTNDDLMIVSSFPRIDKIEGEELRIVVQVYKKDLS